MLDKVTQDSIEKAGSLEIGQTSIAGEFEHRHIGLGVSDIHYMLGFLGYESIESFILDVVPASIYAASDNVDRTNSGLTEIKALEKLKVLADKNQIKRSMIGQGYYGTITPSVIQRNILENPAWYTAYTPYQPEISQGRLEALLNFQTMICDLSGMEIANASMLDEASAAAEAMALAKRSVRNKATTFFVDADCFPQTIEVLTTRARAAGLDIVVGDPETDLAAEDFFGVLLQYPGCSGAVRQHKEAIALAAERKSIVVMAADIMSLVLLKSPGELGADVVVGNAQRFGVPMGFGGPHAAFMATRAKFQRSLPGRLVGVSVDQHGDPAYRLALQTREQHIRREKATSNICTAQVLLAVMASMYACYHGPKGLRVIAERIHRLTRYLSEQLVRAEFGVVNTEAFDTLTIHCGMQQADILARAERAGFNFRVFDSTHIGISLDETTTLEDVNTVLTLFSPQSETSCVDFNDLIPVDYSAELYRKDAILMHPVFSKYHTETEMLRYLRRLADKDLALDRCMIPLGSCTMKLNASSEMIPITWDQFANIHPFAPAHQVRGYRQMIGELEKMLASCTGYDAASLQPNAGSQGEFAGLLAISAYHASRGEEQRNVCLIPQSAHGTNPASAQMCSMRVVVVNCDDNGNIDIDDLRDKAAAHADKLAAIMVTYPSTHGVFETHIREVTEVVHRYGGQVYVDGANLNAMVGLCLPGDFGGDVSHLNLHKTFCIPHGGGGPGVGPVAAKSHLAPFLPTITADDTGVNSDSRPRVSAAPYGSACILPISWMYITMMGEVGLKNATHCAILSANYIAKRLEQAYSVLYSGEKGLVAHECIVDLRAIKEQTGISVEDVAKRLIDYGFHAPTMSFPVAGTLMIEPTESESIVEIDRFCSAMLQIKAEIDRVASGEWSLEDNPLVNAPHTAEYLMADEWHHSYSRSEAAYPLDALRTDKYFSPVGRIDNVHGDRNLVCACPSIDQYR